MTEENPQPERPAPIISRPTRQPTTADLNRSANEVSATAEMLRTQVDQINWLPRLLGFGRRVLAAIPCRSTAPGRGATS